MKRTKLSHYKDLIEKIKLIKSELEELKKTKNDIEILEYIANKIDFKKIYDEINNIKIEKQYFYVIMINDFLDNAKEKNIKFIRISKNILSEDL
ncbi:MAG: hypothetical protein QXD43_04780 [Candidatus Aenigmatarchaeota archaeon]